MQYVNTCNIYFEMEKKKDKITGLAFNFLKKYTKAFILEF